MPEFTNGFESFKWLVDSEYVPKRIQVGSFDYNPPIPAHNLPELKTDLEEIQLWEGYIAALPKEKVHAIEDYYLQHPGRVVYPSTRKDCEDIRPFGSPRSYPKISKDDYDSLGGEDFVIRYERYVEGIVCGRLGLEWDLRKLEPSLLKDLIMTVVETLQESAILNWESAIQYHKYMRLPTFYLGSIGDVSFDIWISPSPHLNMVEKASDLPAGFSRSRWGRMDVAFPSGLFDSEHKFMSLLCVGGLFKSTKDILDDSERLGLHPIPDPAPSANETANKTPKHLGSAPPPRLFFALGFLRRSKGDHFDGGLRCEGEWHALWVVVVNLLDQSIWLVHTGRRDGWLERGGNEMSFGEGFEECPEKTPAHPDLREEESDDSVSDTDHRLCDEHLAWVFGEEYAEKKIQKRLKAAEPGPPELSYPPYGTIIGVHPEPFSIARVDSVSLQDLIQDFGSRPNFPLRTSNHEKLPEMFTTLLAKDSKGNFCRKGD